jgi:exonuclease SbcC
MRPLELRLAHFGPYRDEAVLDFESLDRLFLVCGPTGAGKTTLFDALTYALYERTPGTRGGLGEQLASHHAPAGSVPRVSLRFALGAQQWRVTRHLKHKTLKQRGEGWRDQDAQVLLETLKDGAWEPVPGKRSEINQRLEELVGLSADEFSKIVVLPQGDFQRFLEASSGDREKMLQKLFPVEAYERLVDALKVKAKAVEDERKRWEDRWQDLVARRGEESGLPALEAASAEAADRAAAAAAAETAAAEGLVRLQALWSDWNALAAKRREREALETRRTAVEASRARLDKGRLARPLGADLDTQERLLTDGKALRAVQDGCRAQLAAVQTELAAHEARAGDRQARETRLADVLRDRGALEHQRSLWNETQTLVQGEAAARKDEETAAAEKARLAGVREAAEAKVPTPPPGPGWDDALALLDAARREEAAARQAAATAEERAALEAQRSDADRQAAAAREALPAAEADAALWKQLVDALQAAGLAQDLADGVPCPVCGSLEHPAPAAWPQASAEAPQRLEAAQAALAEARQTLAVATARRDDLAHRLAALPANAAAPPLEDAAARLAEAQARVDALQAWTRAAEQARRAVAEAVEAEARANEHWQTAVRDRSVWTTRLQALTETVPADPAPRLEALGREEASLRRGLDEERQRGEALVQKQGELSTRVDEQEKQLVAQREEFARLTASLEAAVAALGWTLDGLKAARLAETELAGLEASVAAFDRDDHRLAGEAAALEAKFPAGAPPPLEPETAALEARRREREQADAAAREAAFALRDRDRVEAELREVNTAKQALEADFQKLVPLAQALDGRNRLNLKLTTWVLVQALERVAQSATHRLASMSGGRYALKVQSQGLDGRRDWGLDLAVVDGYTGQERAVGTLSGGEKFMTSISLALGLADVIQERSGGLKLEAIFIDEGFGTLDDQSLDRAMAILHDLGKNRSVGIISHVAELRQRISSRIEVVKGRNGSTLRMG